MTRGKHAASAAKRRAEAAYEELDRLHPKLVDAQREAKRYKAEAEAAVALRRQLAEMRDATGIPALEHQRQIDALAAEHEQLLARIEQAMIAVFDKLADEGALRPPPGADREWLNAELMRNLQELPRPIALALMGRIGLEREMARGMLEPGIAKTAAVGAHKEALNYMRMAAELEGRTDGNIPARYIKPVTLAEVLTKPAEDEDAPEPAPPSFS
jgi:hypothetical protein